MARTYKRDSRGRFAAGGGGGGSSRPAARPAPRGKNRLTRDNSGRITSQGGDGATARGGRLRTASGKQRATQTARIKGGGGRLRGGKRGERGEAQKTPKLQFDAAATSRRLERATVRIDKAFDARNTFMVNKLARARGSYTKVQQVTKGDAKQARDIYRREPRYSTVRNPKDSLTPKARKPQSAVASKPKSTKPAKPKSMKPAKKAAVSKGRTLPHSEAMARRTEAMLKKGEQTGIKAQNYLRDRGSLQAEFGSKLWFADGRAGRVAWANRNRLADIRMQRVNQARKERRGGFS